MCEYKSKLRGNLKAHLANVHDIGVNWHSCHMCEYKCKHRCDLKRHVAFKHNIDVKWYLSCSVCGCKCRTRSQLNGHLANVHNIFFSKLKTKPTAPRRGRPRSGRIDVFFSKSKTEPTPRGDVPEDVWQEAKEMMADGRLPTTTSDQRQRWCAWGFKTGS